MHIPDGYISPQTYGLFYLIMIPLWMRASNVLKKTLRAKHASYLALCAAFSFVIMMFNIPIPGGSTGHAVGGAVVAIILGPWAALMAVSTALIIQALLFGDGGITAIAANCFNMAFIMPCPNRDPAPKIAIASDTQYLSSKVHFGRLPNL